MVSGWRSCFFSGAWVNCRARVINMLQLTRSSPCWLERDSKAKQAFTGKDCKDILAIHSFIQEIFLEYPLWAMHCLRIL